MKQNHLFFLLLFLVMIGTGVFVWIENTYLSLPKYKKCNIQQFVNENLFQKQIVNQDSLFINFDSLFNEKIVLVHFFFTRCQSICPRVSLEVKNLFEKLSPENKQKIVFISFSVDPLNDNVQELKLYRQRYQIQDNKNWQHLTGSKIAIYKIIREQFNLNASPANNEEDDFIHSSQIVLLDQNQTIRGYYDGTDSLQMQKLLTHIQKF